MESLYKKKVHETTRFGEAPEQIKFSLYMPVRRNHGPDSFDSTFAFAYRIIVFGGQFGMVSIALCKQNDPFRS